MTTTALWYLSPHAKQRVQEMNLTFDDVLNALDHPEMTYPVVAPRWRKKPSNERHNYVAGRLSVIVEGNCIVTVLWNGAEGR